MGEKTINVNTKCCATCDYYTCNRKPIGGGFIKIEGTGGLCYLINKFGIPKVWGGVCNSWTPWGPIKRK